MTEEVWLPVVGYEGRYIVSNLGNVAAVPRWVRGKGGSRYQRAGKRISAYIDKTSHGYRCVGLYSDDGPKKIGVHILVLEAFVGPRPEPHWQGCHNDGDRTNAKLENLRWDTPAGNKADQVAHGTRPIGERNGTAKISEANARWILESTQTAVAISKALGVSASAVRAIRCGQNWRHLREADAVKEQEEAVQG